MFEKSRVFLLLQILFSITFGAQGFVNSPKIITKDGNLIFESGQNRNISFRLNGASRLNINNEFDLLELLRLNGNGAAGWRNTTMRAPGGWHNFQEDVDWRTAASDLAALKLRVFGAEGLDKRLWRLLNRTRGSNQQMRRLQTRLQNVETKVQTMYDRLELDNCKSNPCENGGTCFNMFNGFVCKCTKNFEGSTCDKDVNECALFTGTDLGCQNGGQCVNQFGGYNCICSSGWFGIHCTQRKGDCLQSSAWELCGHGTCVSNNDNFGYKCICDQGWKTNGLTPACSVDVDECSESHPPCATRCINLPGSFTCAPCAAGLTGSGVNCRDIDECASQNGGCSLRPKVSCINSYGSFHCGECPLGWTGDGRTCTRNSNDNNNDNDNNGNGNGNGLTGTSCAGINICHPDAICSEVSNTVVCTCPLGMIGSGIGVNGCIRGANVNCNSSPCLNGGSCIDREGSFYCICPPGYRSPNCLPIASPCLPNPCRNSGRCVPGVGANFQCQCPAGYTGHLCNTRFSRCGGILTGMLGRFKYPAGNLYEHSAQCAWVIRTNETLVLNVTFNAFELEDSTECRFDWLQINDGLTAAAQIIGRFCGTRKPLGGNIISTTNHLYLWFRSDNSTARAGFDLSWNSIPPACGGLINFETHGTIKTPGSPGNYPKNRDCLWQLRAPNTKRIKLTFFSLQIESHDTCNFDYVEVTDAISGVVLEKFCNSVHPSPLTLPTNEADIRFHSDNIGADTGFQIYYSIEERVPDCGGTFTAKEATIRSPAIIKESISCEYDIKMAAGESIKFEFSKFEMGAEDCIEVYDIHTGKQLRSLQGRYCGGFNTKIEPFSSLYNALQLKFYSKGGTFELKYKADCSYIFESSSDVITSPNYPQVSNTERLCTFKIMTEPETVISLNLVDFELLDSSLQDNDCAFTYLKLTDGLNKEVLGPFCGNNTPPIAFVSKASLLTLEFKSAITSSGRGFKIEYRSVPVDKASCGGIYTKPGYSIRLPTGDDGHYMHNMECFWVIMAPRNRGILLTWKSFKLEQSSDCTYDYVEIYDNWANSENDKPLGRYCDTRPPPALLTHSQVLTLKFVSDSSDAMDGFEVSYDFIEYTHNCGGEIFSSSGELNSPGWPLNYTDGLDCVWTITAPPSTQIELEIDTFELEQVDKCGHDWLEIRNGGSSNSSLVGFYCGKTIPRRIPSFTNQLRLHFHTDGFISARGFKLKWYIFSNGCGGHLNTDLGVITSPLYPNAYPNNAQCEWQINVNKGSSIHFTIEDLSMEDLFQCNYDRLDIFDGRSKADVSLAQLCKLDDDSPRQFVTSGNEALVRFFTDSSNTDRGFFLSYYANCTRTITALHGAIESPNFGNSYRRSNINCTWTIKAPKGNKIYLEFTHFDADEGSQIYLTDLAQNGSIQHVLKQGLSYNSSGDTLIVKQNSSLVVFRLEYTMVGCINVFHRETGEISSPNFPRNYPNNIECVWEIIAAIGQGITLTIVGMDIENSVNCTHDGLIISSQAESTNPKERHCGKQDIISLISGGHRLFLRFYSDALNNGKGFNATYSTAKSTCGGEVMSRNGVIQSPNYPQNYPPSADCEWIVTVSKHHTITFTIEELDLERYYDCEMDYIELYEYLQDGTAEDDRRKLFRKCGELENETNVWTTTSNTALITFKSDDSEQYKGFKLSFKENCGARLVIDENDIDLISVSKHVQQNETCIWQIIAKDATKHVIFETNHVQLNPAVALAYKTEADCLDHGVKVFNGDDDTAPLHSKFCTTHPPTIISSGNALTIKVPLNIISEFEGYYLLLDNYCGIQFNSLRGKFATPYYPSTYPTGINCEWTIQATTGNAIALTIESIDLEQSYGCNNDYLEVRETDERGRLLGVFCGNILPPTLQSASSLWIKFRSDDDNVGTGFLASYSYVMHNELTGANGTIESPRYPTKFATHEPYSWRITVDREYVVLVTIADIVDVDVPYIKFYDGYSDIGAQIDYANTHNVLSNTNILYLTATRGPFKFEWQQLSKEAIQTNRSAEEKARICGTETLRVDNTLIFKSPGYPNGYEANMDCSWIIASSNPAKHVVLQLTNIDLEDFSSCMADSLSVSSSNDLQHWHHLGKFCKKSASTNVMLSGTPYLRLDFVTDASVSKTGFTTFLQTDCGSEMTSRSALVNITEMLKGMSSFTVDCVWTIRVRQGHRIRIKFPESYLHNANETAPCRSYFLVRNGIDNDSPFLGKGNYCENDISQSLETTSNRAYIKFVSSAFPKFRAAFYYEEITHECSDDIVLSDASLEERSKTITSPKYPNIPNPHSECIWKIVAPVNHVIALNFIGTFDLATGTAPIIASCDREYVQINDGATELMPLLGRYCGSTKPDTIYSTGNQMRIKYFTDIGEPHMGFMANVSIGRCGGSYYTSDGVISSPVDLKMLSNEQEIECLYTIELPPGNTINLTMDHIDLPHASDCASVTHLELQEIYMYGESGDAENITDILRICGDLAKRYIVETNKLVIRYKIKSNPTGSADRFKMSYSSIGSRCGETIQSSQGILQTPGYPGGVNKPTHCLWRIRVPKGRRIKIEFLDFDTGSVGNVTNFGYDDIRRFRGRISFANDFQMQSIIARVMNNPPAQLYSTDNTMAIDAFLLSFRTHRGFKIRFSSYERSAVCGSSLDRLLDGEGSIQFKRDNDSSIYCSYALKMRTNETLVLRVEKYDKYADYFSNNYCALVTPFKIEFNSNDLLPGLLCKNETQPSIRLPFPATLKLSGNKRNKLRELQLHYQVYSCGGIVNIFKGDNLTITQPQMVDQNGSRLECAWAVWPNGNFDVDNFADLDEAMEEVQLVVELATDFKGNCEDHYLLLYNGPDQNAPQLGRFCQQSTATNLVVEHGLFFEYVTHNYELKSNFNLSISQGSGCGGKLNYPYRTIGFAEEYKNNAECIWEIVAEPGFHLGLSFVGRFFIESSPECKKDYLRVQQKDPLTGDWMNLNTLCGREPPAAINTTTTEMRLIFRSDAETVGDGFTARFERNCGGILYANSEKKTLESPGYPIKYGNNLLCNYTILPEDPLSAGILVRFLDFDLEQAPISSCMFDNVTIYTKERFKSNTEIVLCGSERALEFRTKEQISIVLRTDTSFTYKGFKLEYSINLCGAVITNSSQIQTPHQNHNSNYPASSSCYWNLTAPAGYKILIKFEELDFEMHMYCLYDGIEIFQGLVPVVDQRLGKFCGNLTGHLPTLSIPSNTGLIHSFSDEQDSSHGFKALVNFVPNCDKQIFLDTNNDSYSFNNYAGGYANNLDCSYVFSTKPGRQLKIEFNSFHVEDTENCTDDYLEVRDGAGPFADAIGIFCGHAIPQILMSSQNVVFMRFVSDSLETSAGFEASIKTIPLQCGDHTLQLNATQKIELKSPDNGNGKYLPNLNCFWKIKSDSNIHIQFEKLDIQGANTKGECDHDLLKFYNSEDAEKIERGMGSSIIFNGITGANDAYNYALQHIYCGNLLPADYFSTSKEIFVKFQTDSTVELSGFKLIASVASGCFRNFTGTQGRILLAETVDHCDIFIKAPANYSLSLYYDDLTFSEVDCNREYLEVFDSKTNTSLQKNCEYISTARSLFTNYNELRLRIRMAGFYSQFDITYLASSKGPGCGGDLYNTAGIITSPFYPNNKRENSDCRWNIRVPSNVQVFLKFDVFDLGAKTTCHSDYLQIIELNMDNEESVVRQFCGEDQPMVYKSTKSFLTLRFHKTVNYDGTGWIVHFNGVYSNYKIPEYFLV